MFDYEIVLETDRLVVRRWRDEDIDDLFRILSDPLTMQHWTQPLTREETLRWLRPWNKEEKTTLPGRLAVHLKETQELIGDAGLARLEVNGRLENDLGYIIHHPWWRMGYGSEVASGLLDYGHRQLRLNRIVASMADDNVPSWKIAEAIGMEPEPSFTNARNANKLTRLYVSTRLTESKGPLIAKSGH